MDPLDLLLSRVPERSEAIRQCYWRSARFRAISADFRDLVEAQQKLEAAPDTHPDRIAEYQTLATELREELTKLMEDERHWP